MDYKFDHKKTVYVQSIDSTVQTYLGTEEADNQFQSWKQFVAEEQRTDGNWDALCDRLNRMLAEKKAQNTQQYDSNSI